MNCLIIKSSPRGKNAGSSRLADAYTEGLRIAGAEVEEVVLKNMNIRHCTGCYSCWTKTPGQCPLDDDMSTLLQAYTMSDLVVYATPLYYFTVPRLLKDFMDRKLPLLTPSLVAEGERTVHRARLAKARLYTIIATAGFPEQSVFDTLIKTFEMEIPEARQNIAGKILIAGAEPLYLDRSPGAFEELFKLIRTAGKETVEEGRISAGTVSSIGEYQKRRVGERNAFNSGANQYWKSKQPAEEMQTPVSEITSNYGKACSITSGGIETLMAGMALSYNPLVRPDLEAVMQFDFTNSSFFLRVADGTCSAYKGIHPEPAFIVTCSEDVWKAVSTGTLSGVDGLLQGKYKVKGDFGLFSGMNQLFAPTADSGSKPPRKKDSGEEIKPITKRSISGGTLLSIAFIPWIISWVGQSLTDSFIVPVIAFTVSLSIFLYRSRNGKVAFFDTGTFAFTTVQIILYLVANKFLMEYLHFLQYMYLSFLWTASFTRRFSLTAEYMKLDFPREIWDHPSFRDTNKILTSAWSLYYCVSALIAFFTPIASQNKLLQVTPYLILAPMMVFTLWFQKWYPQQVLKKR